MIRRFLVILLIFILPAHAVFAGTAKHITLKDGSVIKGELISLEGGIYTVQTENLGRLQLPEANVVVVANGGAVPTPPQTATPQQPSQGGLDNAGFSSKVSAMQNQIMSDPQTMQIIQAMAEDPEIAATMSDPAFVSELSAAVSGNNVQEVAGNPKIQKLMANPKMQALIQQLQGSAPRQ